MYKYKCISCGFKQVLIEGVEINSPCPGCGDNTFIFDADKYTKKKSKELATNKELVRIRVERCFKRILKLSEHWHGIQDKKRLEKWEKIFNGRKYILRDNIRRILKWNGVPDNTKVEEIIKGSEEDTGRQHKLQEGERRIKINGKDATVRIEMKSDDILLDVMKWIKGIDAEGFLLPYKECTEPGEPFKVFQDYVRKKAREYKYIYEHKVVTDWLGDESKKDKVADESNAFGADKATSLDERLSENYLHNFQKPDYTRTPEQIYIGKETREEVFTREERDLQQEVWMHTWDEWHYKESKLALFPELKAFMEVEPVESSLWNMYATLDVEDFANLISTLDGVEPFPTLKEIKEAYLMKMLKKEVDAQKAHEAVKKMKKMRDKEGDKAYTYLGDVRDDLESYKKDWERRRAERLAGLQYGNKRIIEHGAKISVHSLWQKAVEMKLTNKSYNTWKKMYEEDVEKRGRYYIGADEPEDIKNLPHKIRVEKKCVNIIFRVLLLKKLEERGIDIRKDKQNASKGMREPYNDELEAEYEVSFGDYNIESELFPKDYKTKRQNRIKAKNDRKEIEERVEKCQKKRNAEFMLEGLNGDGEYPVIDIVKQRKVFYTVLKRWNDGHNHTMEGIEDEVGKDRFREFIHSKKIGLKVSSQYDE